jgi:hypothetical protein
MNNFDIDDRIRAALVAKAEQLTERDLRDDGPPRAGELTTAPDGNGRRPWLAPLLAAAAVVAIAAGIGGVVIATRTEHAQPARPSVSLSPQPPVSVTPSPTPPASSPAPTTSPPASPTASSPAPTSPQPNVAPFDLGYLPLWPFGSRADALAWEQRSAGGHQPWHLDAGQTALAFTQGYLGFQQINVVTSTRTDLDGAHVGVGYRDPNGQAHTSAVLRLVRFGPESDAPWEVVNSDDTTFSLRSPAYGSTVTSPVTFGGYITGVDENIRVVVRQRSSATPLGQACCQPAGGDNQPWSETVSFTGATDGVLTIVATTGGHLQQIERFTIRGVRG